jgi:hypothetical protein
VSRWSSPQKAVRLAERSAQEATRQRTEKFKTRLMLAGLVALVLVTWAAWVYIQARLRHMRHHHHDKKPSSQSGTNRGGALVPDREQTFAKVEFETYVPRR